jgi:cytochrome c-type biogenesis protein CcmF
VIKALEKPYINILWLGTGVLMIGFSMAAVRRFKEFKKNN